MLIIPGPSKYEKKKISLFLLKALSFLVSDSYATSSGAWTPLAPRPPFVVALSLRRKVHLVSEIKSHS